jgi:hypothetical protein
MKEKERKCVTFAFAAISPVTSPLGFLAGSLVLSKIVEKFICRVFPSISLAGVQEMVAQFDKQIISPEGGTMTISDGSAGFPITR